MGGESGGFAAFFGGFGFAAGSIEGLGEAGVGGGEGGISGDGAFELRDGLGEVATLEQDGAAVDAEAGFLVVDGDAGEIGGNFAFGCGLRLVALGGEDGGEGDVRAGLLRGEGDGMPERGDRAIGLVHLAIDAAQGSPAFAIVGAQG